MITDKFGNEITTGSVCFYSEQPYGDEADSIVHVYDDENGHQKVETIVVNMDGNYIDSERSKSDIGLSVYSWGMFDGIATDNCSNLSVIPFVQKDDISIELANMHFPLS
jgi:hypothetical protein